MRNEIRRQHYNRNTEKTYVDWVKQSIYFHNLQHPKDLSNTHIEQFLTHLATTKSTTSATQALALNSLDFLY
ncbi:MAG: phage integrase N-terminal SAM-like domain-containing protein [Pseudomonadales bacterium]